MISAKKVEHAWPFVCLLAGLCKQKWLDLHDKKQEMGFGLT